jgi:alkanesulfonate monooxygenase
VGRYAESGQSRLYLHTLDLDDLDHLHLVAEEIMPQVTH